MQPRAFRRAELTIDPYLGRTITVAGRQEFDARIRRYDMYPINQQQILTKLEAAGIAFEGLSQDIRITTVVLRRPSPGAKGGNPRILV